MLYLVAEKKTRGKHMEFSLDRSEMNGQSKGYNRGITINFRQISN